VTYRIDSDVHWFYGGFIDIESDLVVDPSQTVKWKDPDDQFRDEKFIEMIKKKSKDMAWLVSHCATQSKRETLIEKLQKHLRVDVYGSCGNLR
jgi:alpha-1,3-fucosyltransferase